MPRRRSGWPQRGCFRSPWPGELWRGLRRTFCLRQGTPYGRVVLATDGRVGSVHGLQWRATLDLGKGLQQVVADARLPPKRQKPSTIGPRLRRLQAMDTTSRSQQGMLRPSLRLLCGLLLSSMFVAVGCGEDDPAAAAPTCDVPSLDSSNCTVLLSPSGQDDTEAVQTAFIEAQSGSRICFCPGAYSFRRELSLAVTDVSLHGLGTEREDVVLDFAKQEAGDDGVTVTSDGFLIEHMWIKNTPGNGIVVSGADDVTFRDLKVSWDAGSVTENGAYAVYPVKSRRVLVEDCEVIGAADAGIYVGQCDQAIVRNNDVHGNVAGIEIENTLDSEVVGNKAYDNASGVLVFVLPSLENKEGKRCKVHNNEIYDNNRDNFAAMGTVVASVPAGTGVLLLAADDTELHDNKVHNNKSAGFLLVSYQTLGVLIGGKTDPETDPHLQNTYIHDNDVKDNGAEPQGALELLKVAPLEDVVWDGIEDAMAPANLCLGDKPVSFRNFGGIEGIGNVDLHSTDASPHVCQGTEQPSISF